MRFKRESFGDLGIASTMRGRIIILAALNLLVWLLILAAETPPVWKLLSEPVAIESVHGKHRSIHLVGPGKPGWQPLEQTSRHTIHAIVTAEDSRFFEHHGLDFAAIFSSVRLNYNKGRLARGGSTITQQVVKMAFLDGTKSWERKLREACGALLLELILSKDEILAWYLNLLPLGSGTIGIKEASQLYFNESAEFLTIQDSIQLALVIPRPRERSLELADKSLSPFGQRRYADLAKQMRDYGYITQTLYETAMATGNFGKPIELALL